MSGGIDWGVGRYERTAQALAPAARVLVSAAAPAPGEHVVDVGAGTGNAALLAAEAGARVTAVDPSPRLLQVAEETARGRGLVLECVEGDAARLPVDDAAAQCVLSSFGIIFAPDPAAAAAEVARVLAPGGRLVLTAWLPDDGLARAAGALQQLVRDAVGGPPPPERFAWHDEEQVAGLLAPYGLAVEVLGIHELPFSAASPEAHLDDDLTQHPMGVTALALLRERGQEVQARRHLLAVLEEVNEDPSAFRCTSRYVVLRAGARDLSRGEEGPGGPPTAC